MSKISPHRRRSIAVLNQGTSARANANQHKRRAYSIAPGEKLSPAAKARRSLVPRKSILKGSIGLPQPQLGDSPESTQTTADEINATQSMEFTEIQPSTSRKSLGRRVSFASHAHVRLFEVRQNPDNSVDQGSSSNPQPQSDHGHVNDENADPGPSFRPRRRSSQHRRSSVAFSEFGEQSMDMDLDDTAPGPEQFLNQEGSLYPSLEEEFSDEEDFGEDMEVTEALSQEIIRRRSLALGPSRSSLPGRRRSSIAPTTSSQSQSENQVFRPAPAQPQPEEDTQHVNGSVQHPAQDEDVTSSSAHSQSFVSDGSSGEHTQPMEFTVPMGRSLRPPEPPSEAWLALQSMTHAGPQPNDPPLPDSDDFEYDAIAPMDEDDGEGDSAMDLTEAMTRLHNARSSLGLATPLRNLHLNSDADPDADGGLQPHQEDSFTSTEDSFDNSIGDMGNQTMNLTKSMRMSLGGQDSSMDMTSVFGGNASLEDVNNEINTAAPSPPPREGPAPDLQEVSGPNSPVAASGALATSISSHPPRPSVFSAPAPSATPPSVFSAPPPAPSQNSMTAPTPQSQTPAPAPRSPAKPPASATIPKPFTFSHPARVASPSKGKEKAAAPATPTSSSKIPTRTGTAAFAPPSAPKSPMKRVAPEHPEGDYDSDQPSPAKKQAVSRLSPSKKPDAAPRPTPAELAQRRTSAVRRPSGYFAQRKSLGASGAPPPVSTAARSSPKKQPGIGLGRASTATAPADVQSTENLYPDVATIAREDPPTPVRASSPVTVTSSPPTPADARREREALRPAVAVPSPTRGSPSPAPPPRVASPASTVPTLTVSAPSPVRATSPALAAPAHPRNVTSSGRAAGKTPSPAPTARRASLAVPQAPSALASPAARRVSLAVPPAPALPSPVASTSTQRLSPQHGTIDDSEPEEAEETADPTPTQRWRDGLQDEEILEDDEGPPISIEQFFEMTGIRFMDELTAPRRSTIHPAQLRARTRRRSSMTGEQLEEVEDIPLAEFVNAMAVDVPQLELYSEVAKELSAWIDESKKICLQAADEAIKVTPALFREFADADESEKAVLLHQLKTIKANNIGTAKSQWYDWKSQWVAQLQSTADTAFSELESDAKILEDINKQANAMLPALREEYAQVMAELEKEQADIAEIENSDKGYLDELRASIAEQDAELEVYRTDTSEAKAKLERLQEKLAELESQEAETTSAISEAERTVHIQKESTSAEVFRLKDELEALEILHLWRATKIHPDRFEFIYAGRFVISIPCIKYKPIVAEIDVQKAKDAHMEKDSFPQLTQLMIQSARQLLMDPSDSLHMRQIVQCLGDFWSSCGQLRSQLTFLLIKYPLTVEIVTSDEGTPPSLKATATVLFPAVKAKAYISFIMDRPTYSRWPMSIGSLECDVKVAYGRIEKEPILKAILGRLAQASPSDNHGCLLDACIEATEQYE